MTTFIHISDTHQYLPTHLPQADILIHSGDFSFLPKNAFLDVMLNELVKLNNYFSSLLTAGTFKKIILVPGNHDYIFEKHEYIARQVLSSATVLINESTVYEDIKLYGSPITPEFCRWAFNVKRGSDIKQYWDLIPNDTDILITHGPPAGILDSIQWVGAPLGCEELLEAVKRVKPRYHLFGHIHDGNGTLRVDKTTFINSSIMNEKYKPLQVHHFRSF